MHDVACEFARAAVRSKDAQKQLARTSLSKECFCDGNPFETCLDSLKKPSVKNVFSSNKRDAVTSVW